MYLVYHNYSTSSMYKSYTYTYIYIHLNHCKECPNCPLQNWKPCKVNFTQASKKSTGVQGRERCYRATYVSKHHVERRLRKGSWETHHLTIIFKPVQLQLQCSWHSVKSFILEHASTANWIKPMDPVSKSTVLVSKALFRSRKRYANHC